MKIKVTNKTKSVLCLRNSVTRIQDKAIGALSYCVFESEKEYAPYRANVCGYKDAELVDWVVLKDDVDETGSEETNDETESTNDETGSEETNDETESTNDETESTNDETESTNNETNNETNDETESTNNETNNETNDETEQNTSENNSDGNKLKDAQEAYKKAAQEYAEMTDDHLEKQNKRQEVRELKRAMRESE